MTMKGHGSGGHFSHCVGSRQPMRATFGEKSIAPNQSGSIQSPILRAMLHWVRGSKPPRTTQRPAGAGSILIFRVHRRR